MENVIQSFLKILNGNFLWKSCKHIIKWERIILLLFYTGLSTEELGHLGAIIFSYNYIFMGYGRKKLIIPKKNIYRVLNLHTFLLDKKNTFLKKHYVSKYYNIQNGRRGIAPTRNYTHLLKNVLNLFL